MTEREIQKLFVDDLKKLIDDEVVLEFEQIEGRAILVDGVAAGGSWLFFRFLDGLLAGKVLACAADDVYEYEQKATFQYLAHRSDDGMLFNKDPERFDPEEHDDWGGDYVPQLDGQVFTIKVGGN